MPLQPTPPAIDRSRADALSNDMQVIIDRLKSFNINLTKDERSSSPSVGDRRLAFMTDYFGNKGDFPNLRPSFMQESEADAHWEVAQLLSNLEMKANKMVELLGDLKINSEHFSYKYALEGYSVVRRAVGHNVPAADTFHDMLKQHFDRPSQSPRDPRPELPEEAENRPPTPPTDSTEPPAPPAE